MCGGGGSATNCPGDNRGRRGGGGKGLPMRIELGENTVGCLNGNGLLRVCVLALVAKRFELRSSSSSEMAARHPFLFSVIA